MTWDVYCGLLDWKIRVEADTEEEAIHRGRQEAIERLRAAEFWAKAKPDPSQEQR
ncbi:MAG TPA: hypothetical protein VGQ52_13745 [Gemmatimonadaceae bacterium]|jgi:hypothetical protein|nr:hypothetical protein [Gemmatimonadaceae bacterium]